MKQLKVGADKPDMLGFWLKKEYDLCKECIKNLLAFMNIKEE